MSDNLYSPPEADLGPNAHEAPELWNPNAAANWSLLFSPVFGSLLIWKNWQVMGEDRGRYWFLGSLIMLLLTLIGGGFINFIYIIIWYFAGARPQAKHVQEHWGNAYPRRSWLLPLSVGFAIWIPLVGITVWLAVTTLGP